MPWVKFSDDWYDDDKMAGAPAHVLAVYVAGTTWCARNLKDGFIPRGQHCILVNLGENVRPDDVAAELVDRNAWKEVPGGWEVVNYLKYQPSRDDVLTKRAKDAERKATKRAEDDPAGVRSDSAEDSAEDSDGSTGTSRLPVPGPADSPVVVSELVHHEGPQAVDDGDNGALKRQAWSQIAAWKAEDEGKVGHTGWLRSVRKNQPNDEHPDGGTFDEQADRLLATYGLTGLQLAQALTGRLSKRTLAIGGYEKEAS